MIFVNPADLFIYDPTIAIYYWFFALVINGAFLVRHTLLKRGNKISARIVSKLYARLFSFLYCLAGFCLHVALVYFDANPVVVWNNYIRPTLPLFVALMMLDAILDWVPSGDWLSNLERTIKKFDGDIHQAGTASLSKENHPRL